MTSAETEHTHKYLGVHLNNKLTDLLPFTKKGRPDSSFSEGLNLLILQGDTRNTIGNKMREMDSYKTHNDNNGLEDFSQAAQVMNVVFMYGLCVLITSLIN